MRRFRRPGLRSTSEGSVNPDVLVPRRFGTYVAVATPNTITFEMSEDMFLAVGASHTAFTLTGTIATAKSTVSLSCVDNLGLLVFDSNFVPGDQPIITAPGTQFEDAGGNLLPAFTSLYVANQYDPPATSLVRKTGQTLFTEGGGGIVQAGGGGSSQMCQLTLSTITQSHDSVLSDEGWIEMQCADSNAAVRAVAMQGGAGATLNEMTHSARLASGAARAYELSVAQGSAYTFSSPSALCRVRLYRALPGGDVTMDTSEDGAVSWTTRWTFTTLNELQTGLIARGHSNSTTVALIGAGATGYLDRGF